MSVLNGASNDPRDLNSPDELELERRMVEDASHGDQRAIGSLYDRYVSTLYRFCLSKTGNETDADVCYHRGEIKARVENDDDSGVCCGSSELHAKLEWETELGETKNGAEKIGHVAAS